MMNPPVKMTPFMVQYMEVKEKHPDKLVLFRMGDFYETFFDDAKTASRILGIALTSRDSRGESRTPMAGIPYHALDEYLPRLIREGVKVAICDQMEDPALAKGLVKREVVRVVTSGTLTEDNLLDPAKNNLLMAVAEEKDEMNAACLDFSTGEIFVQAVQKRRMMDFLDSIRPDEVIVGRSLEKHALVADIRLQKNAQLSVLDDWLFSRKFGAEELEKVYGVRSIEGFGFSRESPFLRPLGALLKYLEDTQFTSSLHLRKIRTVSSGEHMILDRQSCRNLEIFQNQRDGGKSGTLFECLNRTATPMGARKLGMWLASPLLDKARLEKRLDTVQAFVEMAERQEFISVMRELRDLERPLGRVRCGRYSARDLKSMEQSLRLIPALNNILDRHPELAAGKVPPLAHLADDIGRVVCDEPPYGIREGGMIGPGVDKDLDELREVSRGGLDTLRKLEERLKDELNLPGLKVRQNKVFGFYIEIPKAQSQRAPQNFTRKQTLVNAERYTIPELKEYEEKVFHAEERIVAIEYRIIEELRGRVLMESQTIMETANRLSELDVASALAAQAVEYGYCRPELADEPEIALIKSRHPVLERALGMGEFCPNDILLSAKGTRMALLTGPNMAGKSTFIRQVALIQLMCQIGSFVPASQARLSLKDRIFTRVGAGDDLGSGRSTFMVEMNETANILHNASSRSLVILDEVGRGTSTLDGLSLAWAITEELHNNAGLSPLTLFATHFHELPELVKTCPSLDNFQVAVLEERDKIIFLHSIKPGSSDKSYGIHVAKLAGIPDKVVRRAWELMRHFEGLASEVKSPPPSSVFEPEPLFRFDDRFSDISERLSRLDPDEMTPVQALMVLKELKDIAAK